MDDLYDEFGNYIGEEPESDEEAGSQEGAGAAADAYLDDDDDDDEAGPAVGEEENLMEVDEGAASNAVILHEDKQYYPTAQQVYGRDVETLVQEEDAQPLTQPIVAPVQKKKFTVQEADLPEVAFSRDFMTDLMNYPDQVRNVALAGHIHHGKTALMDMLALQTHALAERLERRTGKKRDEQLRYTDTHVLERERGLSIKAAPMSLVLQGTKGKSHLVNILDTPGHVNFVDEVAASLRLVDGVVLVVDAVEGVQINTEQIIRYAVLQDLPLTLVINKMDRLILELRLPPKDAYFKLKHVVEEVNNVIEATMPGKGEARRVSPEKGNVAFACSSMNWIFTLPSFAKMYADSFGDLNYKDFAVRLWGDIFFNSTKRSFTRKDLKEQSKRTFVHFILDPIYKLYSHTISDSPDELRNVLEGLKIYLKPSQYKVNANELLSMVCEQFFGGSEGFVDMLVDHIPSPVEGAQKKLDLFYTGPQESKIAKQISECDQDGQLVIQITKLFTTPDAMTFNSFGRVLSGVARPGMQVRVLGEGFTIDDEEDMAMATIGDTWIANSRYNVPTSGVPAGNWVLLSGVDNSIVKTATLVPPQLDDEEDAYIFKPVKHFTESVFKVAVEPVNPSELPKMLDGLRKINKSYPLITTKVEESGEHIVLGTGELYMDCVLHDLRRLYAEMDLKVSDPVTRFCETVGETSAVMCYAITPNKKNKITMVAEPLDDGIAEDIERGKVNIRDPIRKVASFFEQKYDWDKLAARSIWAFGPDEMGPNILQDDTLPSKVDRKQLLTVKETIRQGFSWGTREGPLCEEPIRNTKFRLIDISLASDAISRGGGQIIPTARRALYSSFLMASPRLLEPVYTVSLVGTQAAISETYTVLQRRRGNILTDGPLPGTPLYMARGQVPVIDSFGLETELRTNTQGRAMVSLVFDRWSVVPGDPLDKEAKTRQLQMASVQATARDFVLKTRRRKGLSEDVGVGRFIEPGQWQEIKEGGALDV